MASVSEILKGKIPADKPADKDVLAQVCDEACAITANQVGVKPDQVSILLLAASQKTLRFMSPRVLFRSGATFPAAHKTSIAAQVLMSKRGKVDNKLAETRHLKFFENAKELSDSTHPVQKMIALPIMHAGAAIGVMEIIRRGPTPDSAGDNFSESDAKKALAVLKEAAPVIASAIPEGFI